MGVGRGQDPSQFLSKGAASRRKPSWREREKMGQERTRRFVLERGLSPCIVTRDFCLSPGSPDYGTGATQLRRNNVDMDSASFRDFGPPAKKPKGSAAGSIACAASPPTMAR